MPMRDDKKQNISLIIGLSIPVAMIIFIAVAINGPRWFNTVEPAKYDFLYMTGQQPPYTSYLVSDGRLIINEGPAPEGCVLGQFLGLRIGGAMLQQTPPPNS